MRTATPEDALAVARVQVRAWQAAYRGLLPQEHLDGLRAEERAARYSFGSGARGAPYTLLAVQDGRVCGFATAGASRDEDVRGLAELYALYVDPDCWSAGVGGALHERALQHMREGAYAQAILWVLSGNEQAARFYRRRGWRGDGARRWEEPYGVRSHVVRYRRALETQPGARGEQPAARRLHDR